MLYYGCHPLSGKLDQFALRPNVSWNSDYSINIKIILPSAKQLNEGYNNANVSDLEFVRYLLPLEKYSLSTYFIVACNRFILIVMRMHCYLFSY